MGMEVIEKVKERPILFSGEMVRAVLDDRKTQTRRVVKNDNLISLLDTGRGKVWKDALEYLSPYGKPGDQLWARETFAYITNSFAISQGIRYKAGGKDIFWGSDESLIPEGATVFNSLSSKYPGIVKYRPSIHMPRWASRIQLEVTDVRVERVQEISAQDAVAEGIELHGVTRYVGECVDTFKALWNSINEKRGFGWDSNPWVWVVEFKRIST